VELVKLVNKCSFEHRNISDFTLKGCKEKTLTKI